MKETPQNQLVPNSAFAMVSSVDSIGHMPPPFDLENKKHLIKLLGRFVDWPLHFPDSCPPAEAQPDDLEAFRLVANSPPAKEDFVSHIVGKKRFPDAEHCRACGLSVYRDLSDAKAARMRFKPLKGMMIARGNITVNDGVVLQTSTPASHYTWWMKTATPEAFFSVIEPE